ncbi:hypothetical protein [Streptomyces sp. NPDC004629]|uniref:hypothetical protein n=1 Tax=Streptomyces sp. NPDC004629 TaxID=3364705 RepID=UPI00368C1487
MRTAAGCLAFAQLSSKTPHVLLPVEFLLAAAGLALVFTTQKPVVITVGAVVAGLGTGPGNGLRADSGSRPA